MSWWGKTFSYATWNNPVQKCVCCCVYCCCTCCMYLYYVCIVGVTLDAELLARSQYSEGPATGHLDTVFSWFPCAYKEMLRWLPRFQVATTCFSCSPPDLKLNVSAISFIFLLYVKWPLPPGDSPIAVNNNNNNNNNYYYYYCYKLVQNPFNTDVNSLPHPLQKQPIKLMCDSSARTVSKARV
jgi:hypothetical protein